MYVCMYAYYNIMLYIYYDIYIYIYDIVSSTKDRRAGDVPQTYISTSKQQKAGLLFQR